MTQDEYDDFEKPVTTWPFRYNWTNWQDLQLEFQGGGTAIPCTHLEAGESCLCTDVDHNPALADYPWVSNKWHEGYGYPFDDPGSSPPWSESFRLFGHQARVEDYLIDWRQDEMFIVDWQESDANYLVEAIVTMSEEGLLADDEQKRLEASQRLYNYCQQLHGGDFWGVFLRDEDNQHNWAGPLMTFKRNGVQYPWYWEREQRKFQ